MQVKNVDDLDKHIKDGFTGISQILSSTCRQSQRDFLMYWVRNVRGKNKNDFRVP